MTQEPTEVAAAVIEVDGRYLITQRRPESHLAGFWEFPGGKRKPGEGLDDCVKREIREELGLGIEVGEKLQMIAHRYAGREVVLHFFRCRIVSGSASAREGQAIRWVRPSEFRDYQFPPADTNLLRLLQTTRQ